MVSCMIEIRIEVIIIRNNLDMLIRIKLSSLINSLQIIYMTAFIVFNKHISTSRSHPADR